MELNQFSVLSSQRSRTHADARKIVLVEEVVQWEADEDIFGLDLNRIVHRYCHLT